MNKKFEMDSIVKKIVDMDLKTIAGIKQYGYNIDPDTSKEIAKIRDMDSLPDIINTFDDVMEQLIAEKKLDLAIFFDQFRIRYGYIEMIANSLKASVLNQEKESGKEILWPEDFTTYYAVFFYYQIQKFCEDFLTYVNNETQLQDWNKTFYKELTIELNRLLTEKDVIGQLQNLEGWLKKYDNPELIFDLVNFDYNKNDREKESFINHFNEFKLSLQTVDLVVDLMAKDVLEWQKEHGQR